MAYPTPDIWYKFEQDGDDSSGNENDATILGSPTYSTSKEGLGFCKGPESVDFTNWFRGPNIGITGNNVWTVAMWLNLTDDTGEIWWYGNSPSYQRVYIFRNSSTTLHINWSGGNNLPGTYISGTWFHLAVTYDGNLFETYVDGSYVWYINPSNLNIVWADHRIAYGYKGQIDNYMAWANTKLTEAQIQEAMNEINPPQDEILFDAVQIDGLITV
jgi:hypothetical protein